MKIITLKYRCTLRSVPNEAKYASCIPQYESTSNVIYNHCFRKTDTWVALQLSHKSLQSKIKVVLHWNPGGAFRPI